MIGVHVKHVPIGNFRDQMRDVQLGLLVGKAWNLGRLRYREIGVWTPLAPAVVTMHDEFQEQFPAQNIKTHFGLRWGRLNLRIT